MAGWARVSSLDHGLDSRTGGCKLTVVADVDMGDAGKLAEEVLHFIISNL